MRKVYVLSLLFLIAASGAFAQRSIDWSVDEVISPTQLNSNSQTGTAIATHFVCKNNGTDAAKAGDTVLYQIAVATTGNQLIVAYPSANQFAFFVLQKDLAMGDTIHVKRNLNTTAYFKTSTNVNFIVISSIRNNSSTDGITPEVSPGTTNNVSSNQITWWNPQGWGVSVADVNNVDLINIYPNPATNEVSVSWNVNNANGNSTVNVYDLNGRVVLTQNAGDAFDTKIDLSGLEAGFYMVEVSNGDIKTTKKLQVVK